MTPPPLTATPPARPAGLTTDTDVALPGARSMRVATVRPTGDEPAGGWPGVIVLHELYGLQPEIRAVGEHFAAHGWAAVVPDFFSAGNRVGCLVKALSEANAGKPGPITEDLESVRAWWAAQPHVDGDRIVVLGFCLGGALAMLLGGRSDGIRAVSANYGQPPKVETLRGCAPVLASYGGRDRFLGSKGPVLDQRLAEAGVEHDVTTYPDAGHSFLTHGEHPVAHVLFLPLHAGFVADAAEAEWPRIFAWFDGHAGPAQPAGGAPTV